MQLVLLLALALVLVASGCGGYGGGNHKYPAGTTKPTTKTTNTGGGY